MPKHEAHTELNHDMDSSQDSYSVPERGSDSTESLDDQELIRVRKKRKKHGRVKKIALIVAGIIVAVVLVAGAAFAFYLNALSDSMKLDQQQASELTRFFLKARRKSHFTCCS